MSESATQPQLDVPSDAQLTDIQLTDMQLDTRPVDVQPTISEEPPQESPPARWPPTRSTVLLIGVPLAGALLVWIGLSFFGSKPAAPPEAVAIQAVPEPAPAPEAQPPIETVVAEASEGSPAETVAEPAVAEPLPEPQPAQEPEPVVLHDPVALEPRQQPDAPSVGVNEVLPKVPQSALDTIRGTVRVSVRVTVDKQGSVIDAAAADGGPSRYFERLSVQASKKWTFAPADSEQQRAMLVKFNFKSDGVTARADATE